MTRSNMRCLRATLTYATLLTISLGLNPTVKAATPGVVEQPIVPVFVTKLQQRPLTRSLEIPATLRADQRADLFAYVSGYVTAVHVDIGDHVKRGDSLLEISVPEMRDELRRAAALLGAKRAHVAVAKATLDLQKITTRRQEDLAREKAISRQALDEALGQLTRVQALLLVAESEVAVAQAEMMRLETLVGYATLRAPFDGTITRRGFDPGAFVRSAAEGEMRPIFHLVDLSRIRVVLDIPQSDAPFVHPKKTSIMVVLPALAGTQFEQFEATITRTSIGLDPGTRTMRAEADLDNSEGRLAPGMYARVTVVLEAKENALLLPSQALRIDGDETSVLVARDGVAVAIPVQTGYDDGSWTEILGGPLLRGDLIITAANSSVAPKSRVKPVEKPNSSSL